VSEGTAADFAAMLGKPTTSEPEPPDDRDPRDDGPDADEPEGRDELEDEERAAREHNELIVALGNPDAKRARDGDPFLRALVYGPEDREGE
jgi:hypothetical protein